MRITTILKKLDSETIAEVFYAGSSVQQILKRKKLCDFEILVKNMPIGEIGKYVKKYLKETKIEKKVKQYDDHLIIIDKTDDVKIYLPRKGDRYNPLFSLKNDAYCKNFTINAMYLPIRSKSKNKVIDFFGGVEDIRNKKVRTIKKPRKATAIYPTIMLKAIALAAELNYNLDKNLFYAIKSNHHLVEKISINVLRDEITRILLSSKPSRYLKILYSSGILNIIIPELGNCVGVKQNKKYHKYDVFTHSLIACDNIKADITLRLAALLHDTGKPLTMEEVIENDIAKITFYRHEMVGSQIAKKILGRLKFDKEIVRKVAELIYLHMYNYDPKAWSDAAIRRFIRRTKITAKDLNDLDNLPIFLIRKADRAANGMNLLAVSNLQLFFQKRIKEIYKKSSALHVVDLAINGNDLIKIFHLKEGPTIGHILDYLLAIVLEDQNINKKDKLVEITSDYLSNILKQKGDYDGG